MNSDSNSHQNVPAVEAAGLGRRFGRIWALAHVDLTVQAGESMLLAGSNGSGKTTLLRLIAGLHKATAGTLNIFGRDQRQHMLACRKDMSLVSHHSFLYDRLTAYENLRVAARLMGKSAGREELVPLLESVGLGDRADTLTAGFSAGMRKRMLLLRAHLEDPRIVMLDEPFAALDIAGRSLVEDWVHQFRAEGRTVLIASHIVERAAPLCDRGVLLERGQIIWRGEAADLPERMHRGQE